MLRNLLKRRRKAQQITIGDVQYTGEQNGVPETDLKRSLVPLFEQRGDVQEAYLARYSTGSSTGVVLCLVGVLCSAEGGWL